MKTRAIVAGVIVAAATAIPFLAAGGDRALSAPTEPLHLVALGDSTANPSSCDGCTGLVDLYAKAIEKATGRPVMVDNRAAIQLSNLPATQLSQVFAHVYTDDSLRKTLADADIVLIDVGLNDTAWARLDNPCEAAPDFPVVQWRAITEECIGRVTHEYKQRLDEILTQIDELRGCGAAPGVPTCSQRGGKDTLLRVVTTYNQLIGDEVDPGWNTPKAARVSRRSIDLLAHAQCEVVGFHGGRCADAYHALNGPHGTKPPQQYLVDGTHLNQKGHQLIAQTLADLGYAPLTVNAP